MRLLVVEDDAKLADLVARALRRDGYAVDLADNGQDALWMATETDYDAVVLDVMIPAPDGFAVVRELRTRQRWAPVLLLTARDAVPDRITGLDAGADDYLTKPFAIGELSARVRALTRRAPQERPSVLRIGDLECDPALHEVRRGDTTVPLSPTEFALLLELMRNSPNPCSRTHLIEHVWDVAFDANSNVIDVYIGYLRDKIDRPFGQKSIETVRGVGYRICPPDPPDPPVT
jgi:two-component system OmpR family response regulator